MGLLGKITGADKKKKKAKKEARAAAAAQEVVQKRANWQANNPQNIVAKSQRKSKGKI